MKVIFNWEEVYDWPSKTEDIINDRINHIIHKKIEENTKEMEELIKFLLADNSKRYWLTIIYWTLFFISVISNLILIYFLKN